MKQRKNLTFLIFIGALLVVIFVIGAVISKNPDAMRNRYRVDVAWEDFLFFCYNWWIPAGIIGIPTFLISLIVSLCKESKDDKAGR